METARTKTASKNIIYSLILRIYQMIIPFAVQTVFIYKLGVEYVGLNGLFSSILGILNLTELGFGTAAVFCLYKPIAKRETDKICALLNFYKKCYRIIGLVILGFGLLCIPLLPRLVKSNLPDGINLYLLFLIQLAGTVTTYLLFAYKNNILVAYQRVDLTSKIGLLVSTIKYIFQVATLIFTSSYYLYCIVFPVCNILSNIITATLVNRMFPDYVCRGNLEKKQLNILVDKIKALFIVKIGSVVLNSVDNVVISAFLGLTILGIYNNYYYLFSVVMGMAGMLTSSIVSTLGNSIVTESREKNYKDFIQLSFWNHWIIGWFSICLLCLYQHFMSIWVGEKNMLPDLMVILFTVYLYTIQSHQVAGAYKDAAGIWGEDKLRPLCVAILNLIINIVLVQFIGLYGILLSTIISLACLNTPWLIHNVHKLVFHDSVIKYIKMWVMNIFITIVNAGICYHICSLFPSHRINWLLVKIGICVILPNVVYLLCYFKTSVFKENKKLITKIIENFLRYS